MASPRFSAEIFDHWHGTAIALFDTGSLFLLSKIGDTRIDPRK